MKRWTPEEDAKLRIMAAKGETMQKVADTIGRSRCAVGGRAERLEIAFSGVAFGRRSESNVVQFPVVKKPATAFTERPRLIVHTNVEMLIADHVAKHGVRRFERGESADYYVVQGWLSKRAYRLTHKKTYWIARGVGSPRSFKTWQAVLEFVDDMRLKEGLTPFGQRPITNPARLLPNAAGQTVEVKSSPASTVANSSNAND